MSTEIRSGHLREIVAEALREFVRERVDLPAAPAVRLPLIVRDEADLSELVQWFRRLCASPQARERFVRGEIQLDVRLAAVASGEPVEPGASDQRAPVVQQVMPETQVLDDRVVTEAALRRRGFRNQTLMLCARAVVTPSARDYARSMRIDLQKERSSGS